MDERHKKKTIKKTSQNLMLFLYTIYIFHFTSEIKAILKTRHFFSLYTLFCICTTFRKRKAGGTIFMLAVMMI